MCHFPVLHCPPGPAELQAYQFPDVVFPPLPLSALSSSPFHCALLWFWFCGKQGQMDKTVSEIICGAQTTLVVKG